jgi:hypothetical protein
VDLLRQLLIDETADAEPEAVVKPADKVAAEGAKGYLQSFINCTEGVCIHFDDRLIGFIIENLRTLIIDSHTLHCFAAVQVQALK